jgi:hypothetical protein
LAPLWVDAGAGHSPVHGGEAIGDLLRRQVGPVGSKVAPDLVEDLGAPVRPAQPEAGRSDEEVGKRDGIQDIGVQDRRNLTD